ncbi:MAG: response regulator [Methyloligellaceae bacterium]
MVKQVHILVVDDDPITLALAENKLRSAGYSVSTACDGSVAREVLSQDAFDLALVDLEMPEMDGFEFLTLLQEHASCKDVPGIVISSRHDAEAISEAYQRGAQGYLTKPINWDILVQQVRQVLETRDLVKELRYTRSRLAAKRATEDANATPTVDPTSPLVQVTPERSHTQATSSAVSIRSIVNAAVTEARSSAPASDVRIETKISLVDSGVPERMGGLTNALSLLIERAARVTPRYGLVEVRIDTLRNGEICFAVDDEGPFIQPEAIDALLEPGNVANASSQWRGDRFMEMLHEAGSSAAVCGARIALSSHKRHGSCATIVAPQM